MNLNSQITDSNSIGTAGLYLFATMAWCNRALAVLGCLMMLGALLQERSTAWPVLRRDPLTWLALALAAFALARAAVAGAFDSDNALLHFKDAARIVYLTGFIAVAWYAEANLTRILQLYVLAGIGFLLARAWQLPDFLAQSGPWWQLRTGLGLEPIPFGYYAATVFMALLIFTPRMLRWSAERRSKILIISVWLLLAALALEGVILSQSRAVWLALLPLLTAIIGAGLWQARRNSPYRMSVVLLPLLLLVGGLLALNATTLEMRLGEERSNWQALFTGDRDSITTGAGRAQQHSVGIRVAMIEEALGRWRQAPVFGLGPGATKLTLRDSDTFLLPRFNDYHNVPLDTLVRYGVTGLLLLAGCALLTASGGWKAWREGHLRGDLALFLTLTYLLIILSTLSNYRLLNWDFRYWVFLIAGPLASYRYYCRINQHT